jgi:hypothetical protein
MTDEIDKMIAAAPITLTPEEAERLKFDLAAGIHTSETIALRYGFQGVLSLRDYLVSNPWVVAEAKRLRSLMESDQGTGERVKLKAQYACEETIPYLAGIIMNPVSAPKDKVDAYKELRQSGSVGVTARDGNGGTGTQFSLTINMPGGRTEKIITTVVDDPVPEPPAEIEG